MTILASLNLVVGKRLRYLDPVVVKRQKLSARIQEQMAICQAHLDGRVFALTRDKTVVDEVTGESRVISVNKRVTEWFWQSNTGKVNIALRYGASTLNLGKGGKNAIEVNSLNEVVRTLEILKSAVEVGELDVAISEASAKTRKSFVK
tara:strand:+ start:301 stop:744 length:444 start_codon:yes stop_codon:yes gene_type:complete